MDIITKTRHLPVDKNLSKTQKTSPHLWGLVSGPEGIRTPDLLSAIEARSQLRYRPVYSLRILSESTPDVKLISYDSSDNYLTIPSLTAKIDV